MADHRRSEATIARIDRYQRTHAERGHCQFTPTCSSYAREAFRTRAFPVALVMTASRLARCNLFATPHTPDPVRRVRRGLRPNALLSLSMLGVVTGIMLIGFASAGYGDAFRGSCTGSANGRNIAGMTRSNPLLLKEHSSFAAQGTADFAGASDATTVTSEIQIISGLVGVTTSADGGTGNQWASSSVEVDDYFKFGVGLYQVDIRVSGAGGSCTATAYVELDGNPLTKPAGIAGTVAVVGGVGSGVRARRRGKNPMRMDDNEAFVSDLLSDSDKREAVAAADPAADPQDPDVGGMGMFEFSRYLLGCAPYLLLALPVFGMGAGAVAGERPVVWSKKVRVRGRPILGFFSGLFAGLGAVVLLWQYAIWTLQVWNVVGIPVLVGVLAGVLAWRGTGYIIKVRAKAPGAATA